MTVTADIQKLDPGSFIELFELNALNIGGSILRFHAHTQVGPIFWQGLEYAPWPIESEGFIRTGDKLATPLIRASNLQGALTALVLTLDDLIGARLIRRRTMVKYLDAVNFPGGNPSADPLQELAPELWFLERKTQETSSVIEWELASALDFQGVKLPRRQILTNFCQWIVIGGYRGPYCGYIGPPVALPDDTPTADPLLDDCGGRLSSCKLRFGATNPLPFGSFPAADLVRR